MPKPKASWLKINSKSYVKVRVGSESIEIRVVIPAHRVLAQLKRRKG